MVKRQTIKRSAGKGAGLALLVLIGVNGLGLAPDSAAKGVFRWVDAQGNTYYGDRPPPGIEQQQVRISKPPPSDANLDARRRRTERLINSFAAERKEKQISRDAALKEKRKRQQGCTAAKAEQQKYRNAAFLYRKQADGERVILNDEQHAAAMARLQAEVEKWCA